MIKAANKIEKAGLSRAGFELQKHGDRVGSVFPKAKGNPSKINIQAEKILREILNHPKTNSIVRHHAKFGQILKIRIPNGRGVRFSSDGQKLINFLNPKR